MRVETVTTTDGSLLRAVRETLDGAGEALLCVAFVHERGIRLLGSELVDLQRQGTRTRLLVTTTFDNTSPGELAMAGRLGVDVRILNPGLVVRFIRRSISAPRETSCAPSSAQRT